jgi:hypothetical protein
MAEMINNRDLPPYQSFSGWLLFDYPKGVSTVGPMRLTVKDDFGNSNSVRIASPSGVDRRGFTFDGVTIKLGALYNYTGVPIRRYSDSD